MKMTNKTKLLSLILCLVLTWTTALFIGCTDNTKESPEGGSAAVTTADTAIPAESTATVSTEVIELGEGEKAFDFAVVDKNGAEKKYRIKTDETIVGDALAKLGLIEGEEGQYGLYIHVVDGERAVYEEDNSYWAFYVNDQYAAQGIDLTPIEDGATYSLEYTIG